MRGQDAHVYVGMRYWYPFMEDAVAQVRARSEACCRSEQQKRLDLWTQLRVTQGGVAALPCWALGKPTLVAALVSSEATGRAVQAATCL